MINTGGDVEPRVHGKSAVASAVCTETVYYYD